MEYPPFIAPLFQFFEAFSTSVPLPLFLVIGSFLEEFIAPLPSAVITTVAGSVAQTSDQSILFILLLSLTASFGKTLAAISYYLLADKIEDILSTRFGSVFGVKKGDLEKLGSMFSGKVADELVIFAVRAFPLGPTGIVSLACGALKIPLRSFALVTYVGYTVRNFIQIYLAYAGVEILQFLWQGNELTLPAKILLSAIGMTAVIGFAVFIASRQSKKQIPPPSM